MFAQIVQDFKLRLNDIKKCTKFTQIMKDFKLRLNDIKKCTKFSNKVL